MKNSPAEASKARTESTSTRALSLAEPANRPAPSTLKSMIQSVRWETERNAIAAALQKTGWNRKAAARLLGVSYRSILYKIEQYQMSAPEPFISSLSEARATISSEAKGNGKAS